MEGTPVESQTDPDAISSVLSRVRIAVAIALLLSIVGGAIVVAAHRQDIFLFFLDGRDIVRDIAARYPVLSMVSFVVIYAVYAGLGIPASFILTMSGAFLFQWPLGLLLTVIGATVGATVLVCITRFALAPVAKRILGPRLDAFAYGFNADAVSYMLFMRLVTLFPFSVVTLAAGVLHVPLRIFVPTTFFGIIPASLAFALFGEGLEAVVARTSLDLAQCRAERATACVADFATLDLVQPELVIGSALLGVLALIPVGMKLTKKRRALQASTGAP